MPPRKKQTTDDGAPLATTGTKPARSKAVVAASDSPARKRKSTPSTDTKRSGKPDLVIVESPAKAKTINKYLGSNFKVLASYGHVRDLPKRRRKGEVIAGIDIEAGWVPHYVVEDKDDRGRKGRRTPKDILAELKREAGKSNRVYLATDPDREGEAIAWHIEDALGLDKERTFRITFNEITRSAVQTAIAQPTKVDMDRVHAQEARRILDRVVGYPLSNLLRDKIARQSSAGRVQSVALRLVVDREREIEAFKSEEYWKLTALLAPTGTVKLAPKPFNIVPAKVKGAQASEKAEEKEAVAEAPEGTFRAELAEWNSKKFASTNQDDTVAIAEQLDRAVYAVSSVEQKDRNEKAPPPFTTSTLQQQASLRLRFSAVRTMQTAQRLYEGVDLGGEGSIALITYMRTDSTRISNDALQAVRGHIQSTFGERYLPEKANFFASGKSAQEAHEAIRPTDLTYSPQRVEALGLSGDQLRLYTLIYQRFVASQMAPAVFAVTNVEVSATVAPNVGLLKAQGKILKFDGFRRVLAPGKQEDATLPALNEGLGLDRLELAASQHFTQPPARYNEASLVKALEKEGIGRPSTYASILSKITSEERSYIEVKERRFFATQKGKDVTDLLVEWFPKVMDLKFTSHFEDELDLIETAKTPYNAVLDEFWLPFRDALETAKAKMPAKRGVETGEMCPQCGKPLVLNYSNKTRRSFVGCSGYKDGCKYIKPGDGEPAREQPVETDFACPVCGKPMLKRMGQRGEFLGCSGYPECKTTMNFDQDGNPVLASKPTEHTCEKCGKPMVIREGRRGPFLACTGYPKCKNAKDVDSEGNPMQPIDSGIVCEKCGSAMTVKKGPRGPFLGCSAYPKCRSTKPVPEEMKEKLKALMPAPKKAAPAVEVTDTCPECSSAMKLRQGRKGWFLGCSKYPKCKGVREVSPELMEQITKAEAAQA